MVDVVEILRHWHAGRRIGEVCSSLAVDPKTVRKYTAKAIEAGLAPGGPPLSEESWSALVAGWFPEITGRSLRQVTWPEIEAHRERIKGWLGVVTVATIHQRLRDDHGLGASESSLRRFILANFDTEVARDAVRVAARHPAGRRRSPSRLWPARPLARPGDGAHAPGVGLHDRADVFAAHVPAPGAEHGPGLLGRGPRAGLRVLRRIAPPGCA